VYTIVDILYTTVYTRSMFEVIESAAFQSWLFELRDSRARNRIAARITRLAQGNLGDWKPTQGTVSELRIDYGAGYRLYFTRRGAKVILLLCGGDKRTQAADIRRALKMADELED
jgi:putative addiction module killer protein